MNCFLSRCLIDWGLLYMITFLVLFKFYLWIPARACDSNKNVPGRPFAWSCGRPLWSIHRWTLVLGELNCCPSVLLQRGAGGKVKIFLRHTWGWDGICSGAGHRYLVTACYIIFPPLRKEAQRGPKMKKAALNSHIFCGSNGSISFSSFFFALRDRYRLTCYLESPLKPEVFILAVILNKSVN